MEGYVAKGALVVVPFIRVPEFHEIIIGDCVNEEILEEHLYSEGGIVYFLKVLCYSEFSSMHGHFANQDIMIWARIMRDDKVVAIACRVEIILHHEAKMSFPSSP